MTELFGVLRICIYAFFGSIAVQRRLWWSWTAVTTALLANIVIISDKGQHHLLMEITRTLAAALLGYVAIRRK